MSNEENKTIKEILDEAMSVRGLNIERLSQLVDIPERYIRAIIDGNNKNLPASPYVRGYLIKIAQMLNLNGDLLWNNYKKGLVLKTSGQEDKLPQNRFAIKPLSKKNWIFIVVGIFVIIYLFFRLNYFLSVPLLEVNNPPSDNFIINAPAIDLKGRIDSGDKLTINNEEIVADSNGYFEKQFSLEPGINSIEFKVKRLLGKEVKITRKVIYQ